MNSQSFTFGPPYDYTNVGGGQGPILVIQYNQYDRTPHMMITMPSGGWARYYFQDSKEVMDVIAALEEVMHRVPVYAGGE